MEEPAAGADVSGGVIRFVAPEYPLKRDGTQPSSLHGYAVRWHARDSGGCGSNAPRGGCQEFCV
jgi:hypothetical protein